MPRTIRFHLDEHVPHAIAKALTRLGIDVTTATDAGLLGAADGEHLRFCLAGGRVIFTQDEDFLSLAAASSNHAGIVYAKPGSRTIAQIVLALTLVWEIYEPGEMKNHIEYS